MTPATLHRHKVDAVHVHLRGCRPLGVRTAFGDKVLAMVPEMDRDVTGLPMIEKLAAAMFA